MVPCYTALILAGGQALRMGGQDKGWIELAGQPLIRRTLASLQQQSLPPGQYVISANRRLADYAALGHLHSAQKVGRESVRYPGTLLKYSVSECNQTKSLHLVTLKEKGAPVEVETYPLHPLRDVKKFRGTLKELLKTVPEEAKEDYVSITLTDETDPYRPKEQLEKVDCRILGVILNKVNMRGKGYYGAY